MLQRLVCQNSSSSAPGHVASSHWHVRLCMVILGKFPLLTISPTCIRLVYSVQHLFGSVMQAAVHEANRIKAADDGPQPSVMIRKRLIFHRTIEVIDLK